MEDEEPQWQESTDNNAGVGREGNDHEKEGWDEEGIERDTERERARTRTMHAEINETARHDDWIGARMDLKGRQIGLRAATNNFQRKLYGSKENTIESIVGMRDMGLNMILATEPGLGSKTNMTLFRNTLKSYNHDAVTMNRNDCTIGGGIALIMDERWSKLPRMSKEYSPAKREMKGRVLAVTFDNKVQGMHNKLLVIGVHGINSAEHNQEDTLKMLQWIQRQIREFEKANPLATTMLLGDLNAAMNTFLDTDRQERNNRDRDDEEKEKDGYVLKELSQMKLVDVFRGRFPSTKAMTRVSTTQTNRLLDRIMVTAEAAAHPSTEIGIYRRQFLATGSDHLMIVIDLPIDTAGMAEDRVPLWESRTVSKWVSDRDELGRIEQWKIDEFGDKLNESNPPEGFKQYTDWIRNAAEGTILKEVVKVYPKRAALKPLYSKQDHAMRANVQALRYLLQRNEDGEDPKRTKIIAARRLKAVADTAMTKEVIAAVTTQCKLSKKGDQPPLIPNLIKEISKHLSKSSRSVRSQQIRKSVTTRNLRFADKGKLMLKMVINSLMRRYSDFDEIMVVEGQTKREYKEEDVKSVVKKFYEDWMASRVGVEERFEASKGRSAWDTMIDIDVKKLKDPNHRKFVRQAYSDSKVKYSALQEEEGIWDTIRKRTDLQEVKSALKRMKKGTAPGPSGNSYDMLSMLSDEHLQPLVRIINNMIESGTVEPEMNRALLRPLAKTDQGLADLAKTRPIALMEAILKLTERVIFSRVMIVIKEHDMLRCEQHGSLENRSVRAPIRALAELIEDALMSGKELHILSADISKAFDSIEYWSQALGWSALGMPKDVIEMLVGMDREGETAVILGQGRQTDWYKNGRGVRQGSIGGPIKWVAFMNFWLEYVYKRQIRCYRRLSRCRLIVCGVPFLTSGRLRLVQPEL